MPFRGRDLRKRPKGLGMKRLMVVQSSQAGTGRQQANKQIQRMVGSQAYVEQGLAGISGISIF